jgi:hypothetical protein
MSSFQPLIHQYLQSLAHLFELEGEYYQGFAVNELFGVNGVGLTTAHVSNYAND